MLRRLGLFSLVLVAAVALTPTADAQSHFKRGDANSDAQLNIGDAVFMLSALFSGGQQPPCMDAADVNDDGTYKDGDPNALYENRGDGTFHDITPSLPEEAKLGFTFLGSWIDLDHDGGLDVVAAGASPDLGGQAPMADALWAGNPDGDDFILWPGSAMAGDTAANYFKRTEMIAGVQDMRFQELMPDALLWLGVRKIE